MPKTAEYLGVTDSFDQNKYYGWVKICRNYLTMRWRRKLSLMHIMQVWGTWLNTVESHPLKKPKIMLLKSTNSWERTWKFLVKLGNL